MAEHNSLGKWGEQVVVDHLVARGYAILERNWRLNHLEIDIIASKDRYIVFVEVKTRREKSSRPEIAVDKRKINHLINAGIAYLRHCRIPLSPRFDIAAVSGEPHDFSIYYMADALRPPLRTYR